MEARFIELAGYINGQMPHFVLEKIQNALNEREKPLRNAHVHILGAAYKRDISDVRESPALDIMHLLFQRGARVTYSDPFVPRLHIRGLEDLYSRDPLEASSEADCVVIVTDHSSIDYAAILANSRLIIDTRNALKRFSSNKIIRL